jgi:hypothetical protein
VVDPEENERAWVAWLEKGCGDWTAEKKAIGRLHRYQLEKALVDAHIISEARVKSRHVDWLRIRLAYYAQERNRNAIGMATPEVVRERIRLLDERGELPHTYVDIFHGVKRKRRTTAMTTAAATETKTKTAKAPKAAKEPKAPRKTISAFMVALLRQAEVPTNEAIVELVKKEFPDSAFNSAHVSWYKGAFNAGKLPGQTKKESFNQPLVRERRAVEEDKGGRRDGGPNAEAAPAKAKAKGKVKVKKASKK